VVFDDRLAGLLLREGELVLRFGTRGKGQRHAAPSGAALPARRP
jgi:hypothetical protein